MNSHFACRREFLHFLAGSPLLTSAMAQDPVPTIASSKDAISVMDFEPLARKALPPAHWGYLATGADDDLTLRMNREAMLHYQLRARRLSGVAQASVRSELGHADLRQRRWLPEAISSGRRVGEARFWPGTFSGS